MLVGSTVPVRVLENIYLENIWPVTRHWRRVGTAPRGCAPSRVHDSRTRMGTAAPTITAHIVVLAPTDPDPLGREFALLLLYVYY